MTVHALVLHGDNHYARINLTYVIQRYRTQATYNEFSTHAYTRISKSNL
jgi:hypothetical protein